MKPVSRVEAILTAVRDRGDAAIADFTERFDGFRPEPMAEPRGPEQPDALPTNLRDALELAHRRITDFHQRQRPTDLAVTGSHGEQLGRRWRPVERAGSPCPEDGRLTPAPC